MTLESNLHVDGQVKGTIISDHDVSIGRSGRFEGNLKAERLLVSGFVEGVIDCACLEIVAEGRVFGELHSDDFVIEPGGQFLGESHPRRDNPLVEFNHQRTDEPRLSAPAQRTIGQQQQGLSRGPESSGKTAGQEAPRSTTAASEQEATQSASETGNATGEGGPSEEKGDSSEEPLSSAHEPRRTTWGRR